MQDVIGGQGDPQRFSAFLANWQSILARRVDEAVTGIAAIDGVRGLILAGGIGRGAPWPLSDIDLIPIYAAGQVDASTATIEHLRAGLLARWIDEGWWTGIDIGRLAFTTAEVTNTLSASTDNIPDLLADDRWYHSIDKAYGGRVVHDPDFLATPLANWLTTHRFDPAVVRLRLDHSRAELDAARHSWDMSLAQPDTYRATLALHAVVKWLRILLLESWGERDTSLARIGTRFDHLASERDQAGIATSANALCDLDDAAVSRRMAVAPAWVHERHDRSLRARHLIGERISRTEDARDVLRVCTQYELRATTTAPFPAWLAVPSHVNMLTAKAIQLDTLIDRHATGSDPSKDLAG